MNLRPLFLITRDCVVSSFTCFPHPESVHTKHHGTITISLQAPAGPSFLCFVLVGQQDCEKGMVVLRWDFRSTDKSLSLEIHWDKRNALGFQKHDKRVLTFVSCENL